MVFHPEADFIERNPRMSGPRILFLVHHPIEDASSRYRIYQFIPKLEMEGFTCDVRPFTTAKLFHAIRRGGNLPLKLSHTLFATIRRALELSRLGSYDLVLIHREAFPFFSPLVEKAIMKRHPKVVFSFDDAVYVGHDRSTMHYSWLYRFKYGAGIDKVIQNAALVIAGSPVLANYARKYNDNIAVMPTVVDLERYPFTLPQERLDRTITVGWYGSNSTSQYLDMIVPALQRLAAAYPGKVRFRFYGDHRLSLPLPDFQAFPFRLETEIQDLQSMDIGLMPLPDTAWTRAKCAFKAIQYMALGMPTVLTPIGMSGELVQHGENGLHATTVDEWFEALSRLVSDLHLRQRIALAGRKTIEEQYSLQRWAPRFANLMRTIMEEKPMEPYGVPLRQETSA
jgi:glycosyltransferase involved in cell wall biosynthesis